MINKIIIVGGGSAGWMTAATLIHQFPKKKIVLIESPNIPTVGVGESTIVQINRWKTMLGIEDKDFMKHCDASYKLGIRFEDFYKKGDGGFFYPFGQVDIEENRSGLNDWYFKKLRKPKTPLSDYAESIYPVMSLIKQNKITDKNLFDGFNLRRDAAYHMDATKFGLWLRDHYCLPRKVTHIKEDIKRIEQDEEGIKTLNKKHKADLFIDCTGFKSLLIEQTLKSEFIDYSSLLPNNSAWATKLNYKNKEKELNSYTNCQALDNGWMWTIPLWSRMGKGYVYSNKFVSDDEALKEFKKHLPKGSHKFNHIKMKVGIHKELWKKNVCAIGLSAGFIEPLESNGLYTVHEFLVQLCRTLERGDVSQWDKDYYSWSCRLIFDTFAEFVALHYALSHRKDTKYWKNNFNKRFYPEHVEGLSNKFPTSFQTISHNKFKDFQYNPVGGIHSVATGLNFFPTDSASLKYYNMKSDLKDFDWETCINNLEAKKERWNKIIKKEPSLYEYLKENIYASS